MAKLPSKAFAKEYVRLRDIGFPIPTAEKLAKVEIKARNLKI